ncbi:MAG TPA: class I SAM-dependent methyltransferase [Ginsengibacter sp.]|nr:methyltransferase domain-containing protein [Chitinophagaceae bacterium]MCZ2396248.1 class I SAM-dependent methyltransferase [Chitinophagales bacterium]HRN73676.1 class I SAM-dependent methyltransferase [Ginsengibacter sp.]HRP44813.1 class I SAM-dependent methyltransferase [Ginsengibacter sp.]
MSNRFIDTRQGHWLLSKMGKRVLRPGGKELTLKLLGGMDFTERDDVIEFAPGIGYTATQVLKKNPHSYTGIELNEEAAAGLQKKFTGPNRQIIIAEASQTHLPDECADKLYGEAMLTMHVDKRKSEIIREAHRLLRKGGYYGIHELGLAPDEISEETKATVQRELSQCIKVNARPLTVHEWRTLLENEGFEIVHVYTNPMLLLETKRVIDDEGLLRSLKIGFNILRNNSARKRINEMRCVFNKYKKEMNAVAIIARKK